MHQSVCQQFYTRIEDSKLVGKCKNAEEYNRISFAEFLSAGTGHLNNNKERSDRSRAEKKDVPSKQARIHLHIYLTEECIFIESMQIRSSAGPYR